MNRRDNDELTDIPQMTPARDEVMHRRTAKTASGRAVIPDKPSAGGNSLLTIMSLVIAVAALGASYFLWEQSQKASRTAQNAEQRLISLESQLTSTGDELSQSDAAVRIQLKELDSEVRKLWDARKKSNKQLSGHDTNIKNLTTRTGDVKKRQETTGAQLTALAAELDEVVEMLEAANFDNLQNTVKNSSQKLQQISAAVDDLSGRVTANEEWVDSINGFRRQVNERLNAIQNPAQQQPILQ